MKMNFLARPPLSLALISRATHILNTNRVLPFVVQVSNGKKWKFAENGFQGDLAVIHKSVGDRLHIQCIMGNRKVYFFRFASPRSVCQNVSKYLNFVAK